MSETPSAYSVEEHMFQQDEIQKRHGEAVRCQCGSVIGSNIDCPWCNSHRQHLELKKQSATIAERDATIAELQTFCDLGIKVHADDAQQLEDDTKTIAALQAEVARIYDWGNAWIEQYRKQIAALQSRVKELEESYWPSRPKPTTEK